MPARRTEFIFCIDRSTLKWAADAFHFENIVKDNDVLTDAEKNTQSDW